MKRDVFEAFVGANAQPIEEIRNGAWKLHESVGQTCWHQGNAIRTFRETLRPSG